MPQEWGILMVCSRVKNIAARIRFAALGTAGSAASPGRGLAMELGRQVGGPLGGVPCRPLRSTNWGEKEIHDSSTQRQAGKPPPERFNAIAGCESRDHLGDVWGVRALWLLWLCPSRGLD